MSKSKLVKSLLNPYSIPPKSLLWMTAIQCATVVVIYSISAVQENRLNHQYQEWVEGTSFHKHADQAVNLTK